MQASNQAITYGRHIRALAILGIPIIVGQLGTIIQGLADTIMVGHFSAHSLAAAGFVNNIMVLVLIFGVSSNLVGINFQYSLYIPFFASWKTITYKCWHV